MHPRPTLIVSPRGSDRLAAALDWLQARGPTEDVVVVGETLAGPHDLILREARGNRSDGEGRLGRRRITLPLLVRELAVLPLARAGLTRGGAVARDAIVARTLRRLRRLDPEALGRFVDVVDTPGFGRALGASLDELRMAGVGHAALTSLAPTLSILAEQVAAEWNRAGLADRARAFEAATEAARDAATRHDLLDRPVVLLDARVWSRAEGALVQALLARAPAALVTVPAGDARTLAAFETLRIVDSATRGAGRAGNGPASADRAAADTEATALDRVQKGLFRSAPVEAEPDDTLVVFSAPGESRECVEVARRVHGLAASGVGFDRMAILLRQPEDYRPYLEEALGRADVPAWFARGVRRPDPAGRAFLSLLRCRAEDFSALRFAEYLSIGEVPDPTEEDEPPPAASDEDRWVPPDEGDGELTEQLTLDLGQPGAGVEVAEPVGPATGRDDGPVRARALRVPRRWERLLVEASVVGGRNRWERRLASLAEELALRRAGLESEGPDDPRVAAIERMAADLEHLRAYAIPLLDDLAALPQEATWAEWLERLGALATRAIRTPRNVLATLAALAPMGPIGPVTLAEVLAALAPGLLDVTAPPTGSRYGRVFVGPIDAARGLDFDVVFVPGMAERVFPPKIAEDPILLDRVREAIGAATGGGPDEPGRAPLVTNTDRVAAERLALELAVGAARRRLVLSYPRIEAVKSRPRVPSFYALETVRAAEGRLPQFEELAKRAEDVSAARIGWPAPAASDRAIDEAEYDLAVLDRLGLRGDEAVRAAGHLLHTNPHLARALRFRAYRWEVPRWTWADGLVELSGGASAALARHAPDARPFSATALQHFAACPYRFYLHTILKLSPREEPVGIEALDPLQRGSLFHQAQFELLTRLQGAEALPVRPETLETARAILDDVLDGVAAEYEERLAPAIDRVWTDGIESIRQDLREWLYRQSVDPTPFEPWRFELSFGLPPDPDRDAHSVPDPVDLGVGLSLRGAIDLVERTRDGAIRVTDHKTGRYRAKRDAIIQGGELLQPVLYGLAARRLFPDANVRAGRLYYCTSDGEFRDHEVPIDDETTGAARVLADVLGQAFAGNAFQAIPRSGACEWCDYRTVCGPDEERRIRRKPAAVSLKRLRDLP